MIDAAAIFPLDAASHWGYEEENRQPKRFSPLQFTFPPGKPRKIQCSAVGGTFHFLVVNCSISILI